MGLSASLNKLYGRTHDLSLLDFNINLDSKPITYSIYG